MELPETPFLAQDVPELQIFEGWKMILERPYYAFDQFLYLFLVLLTLPETVLWLAWPFVWYNILRGVTDSLKFVIYSLKVYS